MTVARVCSHMARPCSGNEPIPSNFSSFYPWWPRVAMQAWYSRVAARVKWDVAAVFVVHPHALSDHA